MLTDLAFYIRGFVDLNHPAIVSTYDISLSETSKGLVLEVLLDFFHEDTLKSFIYSDSTDPFTIKEIQTSARILLEALKAAHAGGTPHEGLFV